MMPSRGWQLLRGSSPRLFQAQCRNLSSTTRRIPRPSNQDALLSCPRISPWRHPAPTAIATLSSIRHASSTPSSGDAAQPQAPGAPSDPSSTSFPNLDTVTLDDIDLSTTGDISNISEKIGYLHEIGLDYGWGPTSMLQWTIEHIHIYSGLPWWGSVALTAVALRLVLMPFYIKSSDQGARAQALMSVTKPITDKMTEARRSQDQVAVQAAYMELMATRRRAGLSMREQMTPMFAQAVFGYCGFKLMRAMANLPVPALPMDGFLWLQDMTLPDPFLILPLAMAGTVHFLVRTGGESGAAGIDQMNPAMRNVMLWGMPLIILGGTGFQPGLVCVWFAAGGALGVIQAQILKNATVREKLNIAPLYKPSPDEFDQGPLNSFMGGRGVYSEQAAANASSTTTRKSSPTWMNTSYQSPNLRRNATSNAADAGRVIDANLVDKAAPAADGGEAPAQETASPKSDGIYSQATKKFGEYRERMTPKPPTEAQIAQKRKEQRKERAKAYEKRYQERRGR